MQLHFKDLGSIDYAQAWSLQEQLLAEKVAMKMNNRDLPAGQQQLPQHDLLFCEHPHVYTLGKSGSDSNLLINDAFLEKIGATYHRINRGGDITYHGPGQLVAYPIIDLDQVFTDIHLYLRTLEDAVIVTLAHYGIKGERLQGLTGVWLDPDDKGRARKICAMGVRCSRWITMHGLALNVHPDLNYFSYIVPCGITDKPVTSMEKELGRKPDMEEVKDLLKQNLADAFRMQLAG